MVAARGHVELRPHRADRARTASLRLSLPYDRGAYLNDGHRAKLAEAFAHKPQAVLLDIAHPSGEIFTYNVDQASKPWPVPVLLVAPRDTASAGRARGGRLGARRLSPRRQGPQHRRPARSRTRPVAGDLDAGDELVHQHLRARAGHRRLPRHGAARQGALHRSTTSCSSRPRATRSATAAWSISCATARRRPR